MILKWDGGELPEGHGRRSAHYLKHENGLGWREENSNRKVTVLHYDGVLAISSFALYGKHRLFPSTLLLR